jgi:hypothetical protein
VDSLTFTTDGLSIAYDTDGAIYTVPIIGGDPQLLLDGYGAPLYSPRGDAVLVRIRDGDLGLLLTANGEVRRIGAFAWGKWLPDGRFICYGAPTGGGQIGVYLGDPASDSPPVLVHGQPLASQSLDAALLANGSLRILQTGSVERPSPIAFVDVSLTGGAVNTPSSPVNLGFIGQPVLSRDGRFAAGYANAAGALVIIEVETRQEILLINPPGVLQFRWGSFR